VISNAQISYVLKRLDAHHQVGIYVASLYQSWQARKSTHTASGQPLAFFGWVPSAEARG
jgi:hypothetical protein